MPFFGASRLWCKLVARPRGLPFLGRVIAWYLSLSGCVFAEESAYWVKTWKADEGLRDHTVLCMTQTSDGYLWMSSFNGLTRFDGLHFKSFDVDTTPILGTRAIGTVVSDGLGRLWISNFRGEILLWGPDSLRKIELFDSEAAASDSVYSFFEIEPGAMSFATQQGRTLTWRDGRVEVDGGARYGLPLRGIGIPGSDHRVRWCYKRPEPGEEASGLVEFGILKNGVYQQARGDGQADRFRSLTLFAREDGGCVMLSKEREGVCVRYLTKDGAVTQPRKIPLTESDQIMGFAEDSSHNLWIGTRQAGVVRIGVSGDRENFTVREGLGSPILRFLFRDSEDNLWVATEGGGISRVSRRIFRPMAGVTGIVQSVLPDQDGGLWIGSHGSGTIHASAGVLSRVPGSDAFAYSLHLDREGDLWVGGLTEGLYRVRGTNVFMADRNAPIRAIIDDPSGGIWVGGASLFHADGDAVRPVAGWPGKSAVSALAYGQDGTFWVATLGEGLWAMREGRFTNYRRTNGLPHDEIYAVYADAEGSIWMGGVTGGLGRIKNGRISRVTVADGLKNDSISGIAEDLQGNFWLTSGTGIYRVSRVELERFCAGQTHSFAAFGYNKNDGLRTIQSSVGSQPKIGRTRDGRMVFTTMDGVAVVDPATMPAYTNPPPVVIQEIAADRIPLAMTPGKFGVKAGPGTRLVEIHYAGIVLAAPDKVKYKYRLEGRDTVWTEAGGRRFAEYDRLQPGDYRFHVIAANGDGVWNEAGAVLAFSVEPFFWQTVWFEVLVAGALVAGAVGAVRYFSEVKYRQKLAVLECEQAVLNERARIARDMHDDLGSSLTQITMLGALAHEEVGKPGPAGSYLAQLRDVSMEVINKMDELVWVVNPRNDSTVALADFLSQYAAQYLKLASIRLWLDIPVNLPVVRVSAEARHQVFLAFKEALNNVVKHSGAAEVRLSAVVVGETHLCISVTDNGHGFDPSILRVGADGLENMRKRLEALGGEGAIESGPGSGTTVRFSVPIVRSE